jgi:ribosomal protein S12 methylthiotransferase accessory factor
LIELNHLPIRAARVVSKLRRSGLAVVLRNLTSTAGIATIECSLFERQPTGKYLAHGGCGTHPDARVALLRAVTEAAQSRVACIQGGREDLPEFVKEANSPGPETLFEGVRTRPFESIPSWEFGRIDHEVRFILKRLRRAGFSQVVAIDLTRPELKVPVVRVIIPKAETWTVFHLHMARGVFGSRVAEIIRGSLP